MYISCLRLQHISLAYFRYFVDSEVLSRVPNMFYMLGGLFLGLEIISVLLIREPTEKELQKIVKFDAENESKDQNTKKEEEKEVPYSVAPRNILKTFEFYKLWFSFLAVSMVNGFMNSYSKSFGQVYISDDKFFATVATVSMFANGLCRIFWGKIFDLKGLQVF